MWFTTTATSLFTILTTPSFWSQIGFFISYITTCLIVLEVLRLVYSDASKRNVEKMLDSYTRSRTRGTSIDPRRQREVKKNVEMKVTLAELERDLHMPPQPRRTRSPAAAAAAPAQPYWEVEAQHPLANPQRRRNSRSVSADKHVPTMSVPHQAYPYPYPYPYPSTHSYPLPLTHPQSHTHPSQSPPRRLRRRSETSTSTGSVESRGSLRRRREGSPASVAGSSKSSSRHTSPTPRSKEEKKASTGLGRMLRTRA